jgi:hypothetical protein
MLVLHEDLVERIKRIGEGSAYGTAGPDPSRDLRPARPRKPKPRR